MANQITIKNAAGTVVVTIDTIIHSSVAPQRPRDFTKQKVADGTIVYDVGSTKKAWVLENVVPLTAQQITDLETLYALTTTIKLVENWIESSVTYDVFFESMERRYGTPQGALRYSFVLQEV